MFLGGFSPNEHNDQFEDKQGLACSKNEGIFEKSEKRKQKTVKEQNKDNPKEPCVEGTVKLCYSPKTAL